MLKLEAIEPGLQVNGLVSGHIAKIVAVEKVGTDALQVFFTSGSSEIQPPDLYKCGGNPRAGGEVIAKAISRRATGRAPDEPANQQSPNNRPIVVAQK